MKYRVGDRIWFAEEKKPYTIQACDERYMICTKPFNLRPNTVQYVLVDLEEGIRGADIYWKWGGYFDYTKREECEKALRALNGDVPDEKDFGISRRNVVELNIVRHE